MTQNRSLLQRKGNFAGKSKNNKTTQICLKYNLSTSLLSALMTYVNNYQIGLIQGVKKLIWPKIVPFGCTKVVFLENLKITKPHKYAKNITWVTSLLSTLMTYFKNISNLPDPGGQKIDMTQNHSLLRHKGNFPRKSKKNKTTQICLKYNLGTSLLSTLITYVKNISNWPDPGVKKWIWPKIVPFAAQR